MAKRNVLKHKPIAYTVIGISSHENDYRLSWSLNEQLGLGFTLSERLRTDSGEEFTCFVHRDEEQSLFLISNRCDNGFLLEKYRNLDFVLKFEYELPSSELTAWLSRLKKVPLVSTVFPIPFNKQVLQKLE